MKNKILAIFTVFVVPLLYFYNEILATALVSAAGFGFALNRFKKTNKSILLPSRLLVIFGFLTFTWLFLVGRSAFVSYSPYASWPVFIKLCALTLLAYAISRELANKPDGHIDYYQIAALSGIIHGIYAIIEYIIAPEIPATWLDPASKELFRTRCSGLMTDPNIFAAFLSVLFIFTVGLILKTDNKKVQIMAAISLLFNGTGIFMTLSRGGWVAFFAGIVAFIIALAIGHIKPNAFQIKTLSVTAIILLVIFFSGPFRYRLFSITKPSDMTFFQRTLINKGIIGSINKMPIAGHGIHTFTQVYPLYRIVGGDYPMNAHNEFLHSMVETGFLSSIILAVITLYLIRIAYVSAKKKNLNCIIFASSFIVLLVQNLSGFSSRILPTSVLIAVSISGIMASQFRLSSPKAAKTFSQLSFMPIIVIISIIIGSYSLLDTYKIQKSLVDASTLLNSGKINEAVNLLEKVLEKQPGNPNASDALAMYYLAVGQNPDKAVAIWENAIKFNPYEPLLQMRLARFYNSTDIAKADYYYKEALILDPASEYFRLDYANFLISQNKKAEAKEILKKGLTYSPGFHNVYTGFRDMESLLSDL